LRVVQKKENEEEMLDIQKREGFGISKSQTRIERNVVAIERTVQDLCMAHKKGQDWIWRQ
jgi:hypothetical protein